jgi:hypothetical protein
MIPCDCNEAKLGFLELNRKGMGNEVGVLCLRCERLWMLKDNIVKLPPIYRLSNGENHEHNPCV